MLISVAQARNFACKLQITFYLVCVVFSRWKNNVPSSYASKQCLFSDRRVIVHAGGSCVLHLLAQASSRLALARRKAAEPEPEPVPEPVPVPVPVPYSLRSRAPLGNASNVIGVHRAADEPKRHKAARVKKDNAKTKHATAKPPSAENRSVSEVAMAIRPCYLEGQEVSGDMRAVTIDWLMQVQREFKLRQETLLMTVSIIDSFLQNNPVPKKYLQLVCVTAMLLASKYEEIYPPTVGDFVFVSDGAYSCGDIRRMERIILKRLNYSLGRPFPTLFLQRACKVGQVSYTLLLKGLGLVRRS
uniref:G2/mitotic-specific cyclin-B1-like n=1 Tax=Sinocyclocheilus grahami TaxID=75366 RepID=A0A672LTA8_SINGR